MTRETTTHSRPEITLSQLDSGAIDRFIEALSSTYVWRAVVVRYARESDGGREPLEHWERQTQKGIARMLLEGIKGVVTFEGDARLQDLTSGGIPARLMEAIARDAAVATEASADPAPEQVLAASVEEAPSAPTPPATDAPEKAPPGRARFSYRQAYIVEKGTQHLKFRLMGLIDGKESKITFKVYRNRPVRPQLASVEAREGIQFMPMGRVVQVVEKELERANRRR